MKSVLTLVLLIGLAISSVHFFMFDEMWGKSKEKNDETHVVIDEADIPRN